MAENEVLSEADLVLGNWLFTGILLRSPNASLESIFKDSLTYSHHAQGLRLHFTPKLYPIGLFWLFLDLISAAQEQIFAYKSSLATAFYCSLEEQYRTANWRLQTKRESNCSVFRCTGLQSQIAVQLGVSLTFFSLCCPSFSRTFRIWKAPSAFCLQKAKQMSK